MKMNILLLFSYINLFKYYNKEADKELVIIQVMVKNANNADLDNYSLQNKEVYIDYLNSQGTAVVTEAAITCYLNARGRIETWQESGSATVYNYSEDPIYINKGQYYRVRLQEWSPSLPSDEQELIKSENKSRLAQDYTKSFQMFYTYKKAGIFFVVEDYNDDTDLNTYKEVMTNVIYGNIEKDYRDSKLNCMIESLKHKLNLFYNKYLRDKLFEYELIK